MTIISQPDISLNIVAAVTEVSNTEQRVLFIGQKTSQGSATPKQLITDIQNDNSWFSRFGDRSMLAQGLAAARKLNPSVTFDAIALDDPSLGGSAATATIAFGGVATAAGSLTFYVSSRKNFAFTVTVSIGDTADNIAAALEAQIDVDDNVPVTATSTTSTVTLTTANTGTEANSTPLGYSGEVAGINVTLSAFSSGAGTIDFDSDDLSAIIGDQRYQTIVMPYSYGVDIVTDVLDPRFNTNNNVLDGVGIVCAVDTLAALKGIGDALNSNSLVIIGESDQDDANLKGAAIIEQPFVRSSMLGAIRSLRLTQDADISRFVIGAGGPLDTFGGPAIASLPYFNTSFPDLIVPDIGKGFTQTQVSSLLSSGITLNGANRARNGVILGETVTTYKTDAAGNPDLSFKFLNYVDTSSQCREYMWNNMKKEFAQSRLTTGDVLPNRNMQNENTIRSTISGYYKVLSGADYVLLQAGEPSLQFFKSNLSVTIDLAEGKVTLAMKAPLVTQLRTVVGTFQLAFDI